MRDESESVQKFHKKMDEIGKMIKTNLQDRDYRWPSEIFNSTIRAGLWEKYEILWC